MKNEKKLLRTLGRVPQIAQFTPQVFESDDTTIATEFIHGPLLRLALEAGDVDFTTRLGVAAQLMDYVYYTHQAGIHHEEEFYQNYKEFVTSKNFKHNMISTAFFPFPV